jgi:hypothetical protein
VDPFTSPFVECYWRHSAKGASLPSARTTALGRCVFFSECYGHGTRQRTSLSSVTLGKVTRKPFFICFYYSIQNKRYISLKPHISQNQHMYHQHHISHKYHHITQVSQHISLTKFNKHKYHQHSQT